MKRVSLPFIGIISAVAVLATARPSAVPTVMTALAVRSESAGGTVSLRAAGARPNDDDDIRATTRAKLRDGQAGTYIPEILLARDSSLARWHSRPDRPLTVWVEPYAAITDWTDEYVTAVQQAFGEWDSVDLPIRFRIVPDSADAEVHVTWIDHFSEPISGRTRWSRDDNWWIVNGSIVLAVHHQHGEVLDALAMKAMALHEVGHLLGLDHTSDAGSIMAPRVRVRDLAPIDLATVRLIYSVRAGPLASR